MEAHLLINFQYGTRSVKMVKCHYVIMNGVIVDSIGSGILFCCYLLDTTYYSYLQPTWNCPLHQIVCREMRNYDKRPMDVFGKLDIDQNATVMF